MLLKNEKKVMFLVAEERLCQPFVMGSSDSCGRQPKTKNILMLSSCSNVPSKCWQECDKSGKTQQSCRIGALQVFL